MTSEEIQQAYIRADAELDILKDKAREYDMLAKEYLELRRKINKAVQYIQQKRQNFSGWLEISSTQVDELLDILEGVNKE